MSKTQKCTENLKYTSTKSVIEITQIINPHKFWFKYCDDATQNHLIKKLDKEIVEYASHVVKLMAGMRSAINCDDVVIALHEDKWIRGIAGQKEQSENEGEYIGIYIWALDYGCELLLPLENVFPLNEPVLAYRRPINVHIGGLSGIVPAKKQFNVEKLESEIVKCKVWSANATETFKEIVRNNRKMTFKVIEPNHGGQCFGRLSFNSQDNNNNQSECVAKMLCDLYEAKVSKDYLSDVEVLKREDFKRLNHELNIPQDNDISFDENAERIWYDEDEDEVDMRIDSASVQTAPSQNRQPSHTGTYGNSALNGCTLSTVSVTLSLKSLSRLNVLAITDDVVKPSREWKDVSYFQDRLKTYLNRNDINAVCSYGWPHVMRGNSLLLMGKRRNNMMLCLPTICSKVYRIITNNQQINEKTKSSKSGVLAPQTTGIEPISIIFVNGAEEVKLVTTYCKKLLESAKMDIVNVSSLESIFDIKALRNTPRIDILVVSVFCFNTLSKRMPTLFRSERLQHVWFDQIDEMCKIDEDQVQNILNILFEHDNLQVLASAQTNTSIFCQLWAKVNTPMLLIANSHAFEAALLSKCDFITEFMSSQSKMDDLIEKLREPGSLMTGSIIIMCANMADVEYVTGRLTQANIKCTDFDSYFSLNQMKLLNWTEKSRNMDTYLTTRNVLVCDDSKMNAYPIHLATHLVHYSLPNKVETFLQRFNTCFAYYTEKLDRTLIQTKERNELNPSICLTYFDEKQIDDWINIYEIVAQRTNSDIPEDLSNTSEIMRMKVEINKKRKPLCPELITKAVLHKVCDAGCPYRHIIMNANETGISPDLYINMEFIEALAPNHFSVRVLGYKKRLECKSKKFNSKELDEELNDMLNVLKNYYSSEENRERIKEAEIGDMCIVLRENIPERCRIIAKTPKHIRVYLIDTGKTCKCSMNDLYELDDEFKEFPSKVIEVFALGYAPSDKNPNWLPEAKQIIEHKMSEQKNGTYFQAQVIEAFDRQLVVKEIKVLSKVGNRTRGTYLVDELLKYRLAEEASTVNYILHEIFQEPQRLLATSSDGSITPKTTSTGNNDSQWKSLSSLPISSSIPEEPHDDIVLQNQLEFNEYHSGRESSQLQHQIQSTKNGSTQNQIHTASIKSIDMDILLLHNPNAAESSTSFESSQLQEEEQEQEQSQTITVNHSELLGSLPEDIQAGEVLLPIKYTPIDEPDSVNTHNKETHWLIDFTEDTKEETIPPPFRNVRVINSIDDLL